MKTANYIAVALALLVMGSGCHEFISPDISAKTLTVNSPADSLFTSDETINFWWEADDEVETYELRITQGNAGNISLLVDTIMRGNTIAYIFSPDEVYDWQVRGVNEGSESPWVGGTFFIDQTEPDKATALSLNGDTIPSGTSDMLQWTSTDLPLGGTAWPTRDSLVVYRKNDSTQVGARFFYDEGELRELAFTDLSPAPFTGAGTYYWQVITLDKAGNRKTSDLFRFHIAP